MYIYYLSQRRLSTLCYRIVHVTSIFYFRLCIFTIWVREGRPHSCYRIVHVTSIFYFRLCIFTIWVREGCPHSVTELYTWLQSSILGYVYLLFESEKAVHTLLQDWTCDFNLLFRLCIFTIWVGEGCPHSVTGLYTWLQSSILGYVYLLFESEKAVHALLQDCTHDFNLLF